MKHYFLILPLFLLAFACQQAKEQPKQLEPIDIVKKSINYHDSANQLKKQVLTFKVKHYAGAPGNGIHYGQSYLEINQAIGSIYQLATYVQDSTIKVERYIKGDSTWAKLNGSSEFTEKEAKTHYLNKSGIIYMANYYRYLFSLPHSLLDDEVVLSDSVYRKPFKGVDCYWVTPQYDSAIQRERWTYLFNPENFKLIGGLFCYTSLEKDGNYVLFEGEKEVDGMIFPEVHDWKNYTTGKSIGKDELLEVKFKR